MLERHGDVPAGGGDEDDTEGDTDPGTDRSCDSGNDPESDDDEGNSSEMDEFDDHLLNQRSWEKSNAEDVVSFAELVEAKLFELRYVAHEFLTAGDAGQLPKEISLAASFLEDRSADVGLTVQRYRQCLE